MKAQAIYLQAITPVHVGTGQGSHLVDLPIVREQATGWPYVPGSSVKGVYAAHCGANEAGRSSHSLIAAAFGRQLAAAAEGDSSLDNAGSLMFTDLRILALPVRSLWGTLALVTCPRVLRRWIDDLVRCGHAADQLPALPQLPLKSAAIVLRESKLSYQSRIVLEDLDLAAAALDDKLADLFIQEVAATESDKAVLKQSLAVVHDDVFNFLCQTGLEIRTRIAKHPEKGIVKEGALWTEEALPAETLLQGLVCCEQTYGDSKVSAHDLLGVFCGKGASVTLQIGGKASTGRGLASVRGLRSNPNVKGA